MIPAMIGNVDSSQFTTLAEIVEVAIVEKQLSNDVVRPGIDLRFQVIHFDQSIRRRRMAFRETGHADPETARIRMRTGVIESTNELHQIDRVLERIACFIVGSSLRSIASERENVANGRARVAPQNRIDFILLVADAGQVRDRIQLRRGFDPLDQIMGQIARGAAGAIGDADKVRHVFLQLANRLVKTLGSLRAFSGEKIRMKKWVKPHA